MVFTLFVNFLQAQNVDKQKFEYAKSFEQSGDFETSGRIYKELFDANTKNTEYFQGVVRTFKGMNKYSELLPVIKEHINFSKTVESYTIFAEILWRTGSSDSANSFWDKALELSPENQKSYITIFDSQIEVKQYSKAINTLIKGRNNLKKPRLFADELCQLYVITADYQKGTEEAMNILYETNNIALAQGRISALMATPSARVHIENTLEKHARSRDDNFLILKVYAWYLRAIGKFDKAFEVYKNMDILTKSQGREVLGFANDSKNDGQLEVALKAYEYIISLGKSGKFLSSALYGYPRTLESKMLSGKQINKADALNIIKRYEDITKEFPDNVVSADASYRIAVIYLDYLHETSSAKDELNKIVAKFPNTRNAAMALNLLGSVYLIEGDLEKSYDAYNKVYRNFKKFAPEEVISSQYNLAELEFYRGNIDSAKILYAELLRTPESDATNNALSRISLIETNKNFIRAIQLYSQAELFIKQKNLTKAISTLDTIIQEATSDDLAQRSMIQLSEILINSAKYDSALIYSNQLIEKYDKSIFRDKAMILSGLSYEKLNQKDKAMKVLNDLIIEYPRSIYAQEARDKIRFLREDKNF